ncbi:MAG TPA: methylenetetrahydrofolate--tRNA-(uracil(54)-C(5))-methyltransferase (FADH(2)-oxidizing) TrmFO [Armatimonadetes bacterium]|nr:methylenetetrahydrofolate--tRNA-(uracil(54)-C(5))-methyltransferase (FADH(2)-oxidizing) TrmFO [Armatimonadota bacterium]
MTAELTVIGGGLAGAEAAWQAAQRGVRVRLFEMRPKRMTSAHRTDRLGELVCSNSLKSKWLNTASGLLNEEMRRLESLILRCGDESAIPGGQALVVDREEFAARVTAAIEGEPNIAVVREEVTCIPREGVVIVATGPLTSEPLVADLRALTGQKSLAFFDAIAPTVYAESLDYGKMFRASRYGKGGADYWNCPLSPEEYYRFWYELVQAEVHAPHLPEDTQYFEACLPVEVLARRGPQTLLFGPMKAVGLTDPRTGRQPHAVVQLRQEDRAGELYGLVGFQTQLRRREQRRVFGLVPGLEGAEYARYGSVHRNTFLNAPRLLQPTLQLRQNPDLFIAGQLVGVEGYIESAGAGLLAGVNAARRLRGQDPLILPRTTMLGALMRYISDPWVERFQPMNANFGLLPRLPRKIKDRQARYQALAERALADLEQFMNCHRWFE